MRAVAESDEPDIDVMALQAENESLKEEIKEL